MNTTWICPICSTSNEKTSIVCFVCGYERKKKTLSEDELLDLFEKGVALLEGADIDSGIELLSRASEYKYIPARMKLAECYKAGIGMTADTRKAYELYLSVAKRGDQEAQYQVACCYFKGIGTSKNLDRTVNWLRKAIDQGHMLSIRMLAAIYMDVSCSYCNAYRAISLLKTIDSKCLREVGKHDFEAITDLGICHQRLGKNIKAASQLKKGAKAGIAKAQYLLARCYEEGRGVIKSNKKAKEWFALAASSGYSESLDCVESDI